jgi:hypothetical protein
MYNARGMFIKFPDLQRFAVQENGLVKDYNGAIVKNLQFDRQMSRKKLS